MPRLTKQRKQALAADDLSKSYPLEAAVALVRKMGAATKFDSSVDMSIRLGIDPKKSDQMVRGTTRLPHGTGKTLRILVLCQEDKKAEAEKAGADFVGLDDYIEKISKGWTDVDVVITQPSLMARLAKLGRVLGPRGLMPNPKTGTITDDISTTVAEVRKGKIELKADKTGIVHAAVGRCSFEEKALQENVAEVLSVLQRIRPSGAKGQYMRSVHLSATMSPSVRVDRQSFSF